MVFQGTQLQRSQPLHQLVPTIHSHNQPSIKFYNKRVEALDSINNIATIKHMKREKQLSIQSGRVGFGGKGASFGGILLKNSHAKCKRPLSFKTPMHLVLRSSQAQRKKSFLYQHRELEKIISRHAKKQKIRMLEMANGGDHLHLILRIPRNRKHYIAFVRGLSGEIARLISGAKKGTALLRNSKKNKFWDHKPFTRLFENWGASYKELKRHLQNNKPSQEWNAQTLSAFISTHSLEATGFS